MSMAVPRPSLAPPPVATLAAVQRLLAGAFAESEGARDEAPLEVTAADPQPARLISASLLEDRELQSRKVAGEPTPAFVAFLDGTQTSNVVRYLRGGVPIVFGTVAAVIRDRRSRRLHTWTHVVERRLYAPEAFVAPPDWDRLAAMGFQLCDTADERATSSPDHPLAMREAAVHRVQKDREHAEQSLAAEWCRKEERPLFVDGSISGAESVARAESAVGVVKSHRTLYASGEALATVLSLRAGHRSSVFEVTSPRRAPVASWYLRMRDPVGQDPMWGLVRVEVATGLDAHALTRRADDVSRWILAEGAPVSLPDGRWDKMVYGVRDCEEFLRAIV